MSHPQFEPKLTAIPEIPKEFGEDGGHFYRRYDALADELDEDMVKSLKSQLDSTLIFAGLFAGVNTAFLALTLPKMSADPADDTNALLLQLVKGGNSSIQSTDDLPSATFTPSSGIVPVNVLFSLCLTLAIIVAFLAILGQQWLVHYRKRSGGGIEHQRWEQLRRYLGVRRWRLEGVLDDILPALLQLGMLIFGVAFVVYLQTLSKTVCFVVATPIAGVVEIVVLMACACILDHWCPFQSTWSRLVLRGLYSPKYHPITLILIAVGWALLVPPIIALNIVGVIGLVLIAPLVLGYVFYNIRRIFFKLKLVLTRGEYLYIPVTDLEFDLRSRLGKGAVPLKKPPAFLKGAAIKRVLCTSGDFNTLIYAAINIRAMNEKKSARYLLQSDAVHERLEELVKSPDRMLASAFCCAFSHLLLGGQYIGLFVKQQHRHLYRWRNSLSQQHLYYEEPHPLKERVAFICDQLNTCMESPDMRQDAFVETLLYFELLKLILDEKSHNQELSKWLDGVMQKQQPSEVSTPLVICLVADAVRILKKGLASAAVPSGLPISQQGPDLEQEEQERLRCLEVQEQRVEEVKKLVRAVRWEIKLVPSDPSQSKRKSALGLIEEAFSIHSSQSIRHPDKTDIWLLEQALLISTSNQHKFGWKFVAKSSVDLLLSFDKPADPTPESVSTQDRQSDNRLRCAKILSQCIRATREHLEPKEFIQTVSPALDKLVDYWARFRPDFTQNPDLNDSDMLSSWFEIRSTLNKSEESGWGRLHQQQFGEAYPGLRIGFDAIASTISGIETVPPVDRDPTELSRLAAFDGQRRQIEPDDALADRVRPKSDEHVDNPQEETGESREDEDAQEPNSRERDERPDNQAGNSGSKPMDGDE